MAKQKYLLGAKLVKHGPEPADGGYPTGENAFAKQCLPYKDTVEMDDEDGEVVKHFLQGARYPFLTIYSAAGTNFKFSVPMDNENLKEWMGGEIVNGQWKAPRGNYQTTRCIEIMTEFDIPITIPRATCYGVRRFAKKTTDISLIEINVIVELPTAANVAPMVIGMEEAAAGGEE